MIVLLMLVMTTSIGAQTCEQREENLKSSLASFSAAVLYNTYGLIGSISDGFGQDVYNDETAINLLDAQNKLMDNLVRVLDELNKTHLPEKDSIYINSASNILRGLKKQSELMQDYCNNKRQQKLNAYEEQRKKNWSDISKLMGVKE